MLISNLFNEILAVVLDIVYIVCNNQTYLSKAGTSILYILEQSAYIAYNTVELSDHLNFPTSCDNRQKFMVPKYFFKKLK